MHKSKQLGKGGRSKAPAESGDQEWSFRNIRKEIETLGSSCLTWKERKDQENRRVVELGGKAPKKQRFPLSVARAAMKNQKQRDEKLTQERLALGRFGALLGGTNTNKRNVDRRKPVDTGLKPSSGNFVNGCLHVDRLLKTSRKEEDNGPPPMARKPKTKGGDKKGSKKKQKKKGGGRGKRH